MNVKWEDVKEDYARKDAQIKSLQEANTMMVCCLADISNMCVGDITMGYKLDAANIGEVIYEVTGLDNPALNEHAKALNTGSLLTP